MTGNTANASGGEEAARVRALHDLHALDSPTDVRFDRIARLAALTFEAPRAAVVLVDQDRLFLKGQFGVAQREHPRAGSLADIMVARAQVAISRDITRDAAFKALLPTLSQVDVRFFACAPLITPGGEVVGLLSLGDPKPHREATKAQRQALADLAAMAMEELLRDAELARHARRLDIAVEAGGLAEFEWEIAADRLVVGPRAAAITGLPEGTLPSALRAILHAGPLDAADRERFSRAVRQTLAGRAGLDVEFSWTRPDSGRPICLSVRAVRLEDGDPPVQRLVGVLQDVTQRRQEDQRREVLAGELDHRVKNMLAVIQSVANQSARKTTSLDAFLKTFTGRLKAMASAHELLTATRWAGAYLRDVVAAELGGLAPGQIDSGGPELYLTPRAASAVALALHELAANALRQGALSEDRGRVTVRWSATPAGGFLLDWRESGGPAAGPMASDGFGGVLLSEITGRELEGQVTLEPSAAGLRASIEAAAAALASPPSDAAEPAPRLAADEPAQVVTLESDPGRIAGLKILIVEDSLLLALELEQGLTDLGAQIVGTAAEVDEAMAMIDRPFDAAVLDANLNGASVMPVAEALHAMGRPFIFATGYADKAGPAGFDAPVVRKPYNVGQIARALAQVCARPGADEPVAARPRATGRS